MCIGQARHTPIQAIEHHGHEHSGSSYVEVAVHRVDDGIETGKQVGRGEQIGQQIDAAMAHLAPFGILPFLYVLVDRQQAFQIVASRLLILGTFTHEQHLATGLTNFDRDN